MATVRDVIRVTSKVMGSVVAFGLIILTACSDEDHSPAGPDDGNSNEILNFAIFTMEANGSNVVKLTDDEAWDMVPVWSPDGTKIAFLSIRWANLDLHEVAEQDIHVMATDGSNRINLTSDAASEDRLSWSPDGTKIAFISRQIGGVFDVYIMEADGDNLINLTFNGVF